MLIYRVEPIIRSVNINETETERKNINYNIEKDNASHSTPVRSTLFSIQLTVFVLLMNIINFLLVNP